MGFFTNDGMHEGYLVPQFFDGQRGTGTMGAGIPEDQIAIGGEVQAIDGSWSTPTRPAGEVTGWVICCDCYQESGGPGASWVGPVFTRVASEALENVAERRIHAPDAAVAYVSDRDDVLDVVVDLWRAEHAFTHDALAEVEAATMALSEARLRLDAAVGLARHGGASWADVGRAAGMTRQSAQERWRTFGGN